MNFVLLIILLIVLLTAIKIFNDLIAPSVIYILVFFISTFIAFLNQSMWGDISPLTVIVILIGTFSFLTGGIFAREIVRKTNNGQSIKLQGVIKINNNINASATIFMLIVTVVYFGHVYQLSLNAGNPGGFTAMLSFARTLNPESEGFIKLNEVLNLGLIVSQALGFIYLYILLFNKIIAKRTPQKIVLLPILLYVLQSILTTGRVKLINYIIFAFIIYVFIYRLNNNDKKVQLKVLKYAIFTVLLIGITFALIDMTLRSSIYGTSWGLLYQFSKYGGSSIKALDIYLNGPRLFEGYETLYNIHSILNRFGFNYYIDSNALDSVRFGNITTNIYTPLRRYINDYGVLGLIVIQVITGFMINFYFEILKKKFEVGLSLLIYSFIAYFVFYSSFEERFFLSVLSLNSMLTIVLIMIFWYSLKLKRKVKELCI